MPGVFVWEIDNLLPIPLDDDYVGKFFEGDCYIVMLTFLDEAQNLAWKIHYWIGKECAVSDSQPQFNHLPAFVGNECLAQIGSILKIRFGAPGTTLETAPFAVGQEGLLCHPCG